MLALFDLDGFKHYNDTFGHPAGDVLLARLGANLRAYLGTRGSVFRMGGDEFCALFEPRGEDVPSVLDGAALALSEHGDGFWIGCSYGSISLPREAADASEALRIADQRMYAQKHAGRMSASRQVKEALLRVLGARDPGLEARARAVADLAEATARELDLGREERESVRLAAELHDAGRLMLPGDAGVSRRELALAGERIVSAAPALAHTARLIGTSHLRWDEGGESIPLGARIVAVAVAFHELGEDPAAGDALDALRADAGGRFDPAVVEALAASAAPVPVG